MGSIAKAGLSAKFKRRNLIKLTVVATIAVIGIVMSVMSVLNAQYVFALLYFIAALLGTLYAIIKINTVLPPMIECDNECITLSTWDNGLFPFNIHFKPTFFADFIPAKTKSYEIPLSEIDSLLIGSKGFVSRTVSDSTLEGMYKDMFAGNRRLSELAKRCDILYLKLKSGRVYIMSVNDFDPDELYRIVDKVEHLVQGIDFKTNIRKLRKKRDAEILKQRI